MELKDYLHFYEGAMCRWRYVDYSPEEWNILAPLSKRDIARLCDDHSVDKIELHLRPLSDMTEEETKEASNIWFDAVEKYGRGIRTYSIVTNWYRSKHIDIDGLIEAGLAIDSTKQ